MRRWIPLMLFASCLSLMALCRWTGLLRKLVRRPATYLGIMPIILGGSIAILGLWHLGRAKTTTGAFHESSRLVTHGIYHYTRNPIYLGEAVMLIGACLLFGARCMMVPVGIFILVADHWIIRVEERMLANKFGLEFEQYRVRTHRWI